MSQHDRNDEGRRRFLKVAAGGVAAATVLGTLPGMAKAQAQGQDLPHVSPSDPTATALKYVEDAAKSPNRKDAKAFCHNCNFYQGKASNPWGPCQLFPGRAVAADGWCVSHVLAV